jgi:hypothetical protein
MDKQPDVNKLERVAKEAEVSKGRRTRTAPHVWKIGAATAIDNPRAASLSFAFFLLVASSLLQLTTFHHPIFTRTLSLHLH